MALENFLTRTGILVLASHSMTTSASRLFHPELQIGQRKHAKCVNGS
jgi:hypothetical protein